MANREPLNPKLLLLIGGLALVLFSAIAIFLAAGFTPRTSIQPSSPTGSVSVEHSP